MVTIGKFDWSPVMRSRVKSSLAAGFLLLTMLIPAAKGFAQATSTASRAMDIAAFGGYSAGFTDYAQYKDQGLVFGADVTRYFHLPIVPSLEVRGNVLHSAVIDETTYLVGARVEFPLKQRLHPYGAFLVGPGTLHFKYTPSPGYTASSSKVLSYGGGLDVDLFHNLQLKLDAQYQSWNLGPNGAIVPQGGNFTLTPSIFMVGVEYHIPFRTLNRQRDFYH
jgi:opacity protein-like surface antigen